MHGNAWQRLLRAIQVIARFLFPLLRKDGPFSVSGKELGDVTWQGTEQGCCGHLQGPLGGDAVLHPPMCASWSAVVSSMRSNLCFPPGTSDSSQPQTSAPSLPSVWPQCQEEAMCLLLHGSSHGCGVGKCVEQTPASLCLPGAEIADEHHYVWLSCRR